MSDELINEEEQFLALLAEEAAEIAAKKEAEATEEIAEEKEEPELVEEKVFDVAEEKPAKPEKTEKKSAEKTVALLSTRNVTWNGVGSVEVGYNIVTEEQAEKWLTRSHITLATPEDVAKGYGL
jgi:DNA-binding protein H-NS